MVPCRGRSAVARRAARAARGSQGRAPIAAAAIHGHHRRGFGAGRRAPRRGASVLPPRARVPFSTSRAEPRHVRHLGLADRAGARRPGRLASPRIACFQSREAQAVEDGGRAGARGEGHARIRHGPPRRGRSWPAPRPGPERPPRATDRAPGFAERRDRLRQAARAHLDHAELHEPLASRGSWPAGACSRPRRRGRRRGRAQVPRPRKAAVLRPRSQHPLVGGGGVHGTAQRQEHLRPESAGPRAGRAPGPPRVQRGQGSGGPPGQPQALGMRTRSSAPAASAFPSCSSSRTAARVIPPPAARSPGTSRERQPAVFGQHGLQLARAHAGPGAGFGDGPLQPVQRARSRLGEPPMCPRPPLRPRRGNRARRNARAVRGPAATPLDRTRLVDPHRPARRAHRAEFSTTWGWARRRPVDAPRAGPPQGRTAPDAAHHQLEAAAAPGPQRRPARLRCVNRLRRTPARPGPSLPPGGAQRAAVDFAAGGRPEVP